MVEFAYWIADEMKVDEDEYRQVEQFISLFRSSENWNDMLFAGGRFHQRTQRVPQVGRSACRFRIT